jgi:hypothetical protein
MPVKPKSGFISAQKRKHQAKFTTYTQRLAIAGFTATGERFTEKSKKWFMDKARSLSEKNVRRELSKEIRNVEKEEGSVRFLPGAMYTYFYDPKHKDTLPYYDKFPLIFLIDLYKDGPLGLTLHYLPPKLRALFMDQLLLFANNDRYDKTTKLKLSWQLMKATLDTPMADICVKRYLYSHFRSRALFIPASEWEAVIYLPTATFEKKSQTAVWRDAWRKFKS